MSERLHKEAQTRLRASGQRYTDGRRLLVELLLRAGHPLSIPEVLGLGKGMKQSSVYRNLSGLEQAGVVRRVATEDEHGRYELAEELTGHHHHLICSRCGRVQDVAVSLALEATLDRALDRIATRAGFASVSHRLDLIGLCAECSARA